MTAQEIEKLAEAAWEGCHHCDENDKYFWIKGYVIGYLHARVDNIEEKIESSQNKITDMFNNLINKL
jgi:hypothetical protein